MRMKRKLLCAFALCFLSVSALADAPDETERLVVYTSHKEEVYQPIVEEFERRTGVWVQVVSGGTTELLERIAAGSGNARGRRDVWRRRGIPAGL